MLAMRNAPAVCEEEGPTMIGPTISLMLIGFMHALLAIAKRAAHKHAQPAFIPEVRITAVPYSYLRKHKV